MEERKRSLQELWTQHYVQHVLNGNVTKEGLEQMRAREREIMLAAIAQSEERKALREARETWGDKYEI